MSSGDVDTLPAPADTPEPQAAAAQEQDEATQERPNGASLVLQPILPPPVQFLADTVATGVAVSINGLKNTTCALARMHAARATASLTHAQLLTSRGRVEVGRGVAGLAQQVAAGSAAGAGALLTQAAKLVSAPMALLQGQPGALQPT